MGGYCVDVRDVRCARDRIASRVHRTPVMTCRTLDALAGARLFFKCENFQRIGAFKIRGATNAILQLGMNVEKVVTHSSGNHAQAVAMAARDRGLEAVIVMPDTAPATKRRACEGYGARIVGCAPSAEAREEKAREVLESTGGTLVPPVDHPHVIAGQGTVALELLEQVGDLDALVVPVGGGGILSGVTLAAQATKPGIRVFAAEPLAADDAARSKVAGERLAPREPNSIADGLLTGLGELTWPVIRDRVEDVITVTERQISAAMWLVWERMKLIIEPSAAVGAAAVLCGQLPDGIRRVGVVFTGGNVDFARLPERPSGEVFTGI